MWKVPHILWYDNFTGCPTWYTNFVPPRTWGVSKCITSQYSQRLASPPPCWAWSSNKRDVEQICSLFIGCTWHMAHATPFSANDMTLTLGGSQKNELPSVLPPVEMTLTLHEYIIFWQPLPSCHGAIMQSYYIVLNDHVPWWIMFYTLPNSCQICWSWCCDFHQIWIFLDKDYK